MITGWFPDGYFSEYWATGYWPQSDSIVITPEIIERDVILYMTVTEDVDIYQTFSPTVTMTPSLTEQVSLH